MRHGGAEAQAKDGAGACQLRRGLSPGWCTRSKMTVKTRPSSLCPPPSYPAFGRAGQAGSTKLDISDS
jgi:hypothetical protein